MKHIFGVLTVALVAGGAAQAQTFAETKLTAGDGATDWFGHSVALSNGTALVGAIFDDEKGTASGAAYLFDADGTQTQKLTAGDGSAGDSFGTSVALSDGTALVGAWGNIEQDTAGGGSAYLFNADGTQTQTLTAGDGAAFDEFGTSVALSGGTALIGATYGNDSRGSAYLFDADGTQAHKLTASDGAVNDFFGYSVALSDGTALIGAWGDDDKGDSSGSAYLFGADGTQTHKMMASDGAASDFFGYSVALSDGTALVGAWGDDDQATNGGSAYLFDADGTQTHKLMASDGGGYDAFGWSVAISGNLVLVGAAYSNAKGNDSGAAYLYHAETGVELAKLTASDGAAFDEFGTSVALDGSTALIGARNAGGKGAAYLYDLSPTWTSVFGGGYDDADNWNLLTPGFDPSFDVKINPDRGNQVITGPAGASEVGTL